MWGRLISPAFGTGVRPAFNNIRRTAALKLSGFVRVD